MFNPRLLIQLPLILLGSCVPMTPNSTSIMIYTNGAGRVMEATTNKEGEDICRGVTQTLLKEYKLPKLPDFKGIDEGDNEAVVKELQNHIKILRYELMKVVKEANCGQKMDPPKRT